jgi:hypothetical protein
MMPLVICMCCTMNILHIGSLLGKVGDGPKERAKPPKALLLVGCNQYFLFVVSRIYLLFTV